MTQPGAGGGDRLQPLAPFADQRDQFGIPIPAAGIDQLAGGGIGKFTAKLAGQPIVQVIGDQQQAGDLVQPGRFFIEQGPDLIEAVELEELDTTATIDLIAGQLLPDPLRHAVGTGIAIGHSITEHLARRIQQDKIDPQESIPIASSTMPASSIFSSPSNILEKSRSGSQQSCPLLCTMPLVKRCISCMVIFSLTGS